MCTFLNELPKYAKTIDQPKKQQLFLSLKPTSDPKEYYRFRLLWYKNPKTNRDYPFIERFTHTAFVKNEDGKWVMESQVVCPITPHVKMTWDGDPYNTCPICNFSNHNFLSFKESGWKDKESARKSKQFSRKFEACIPVYVVYDPIYELNQGKFKVIKFFDKKEYENFRNLVSRESHETCVFNGKMAVDLYIKMTEIEKVANEGNPNEYHYKQNVITKIGFTTKPYDIPAITKEAIDEFQFDDQFFTSSTKEELKEFHTKYCVKINNDDIPMDEEVSFVTSSRKSEPTVTKAAPPPPKNDIPDDINDDHFGSTEPELVSDKKLDTSVSSVDLDDIENLLEDI